MINLVPLYRSYLGYHVMGWIGEDSPGMEPEKYVNELVSHIAEHEAIKSLEHRYAATPEHEVHERFQLRCQIVYRTNMFNRRDNILGSVLYWYGTAASVTQREALIDAIRTNPAVVLYEETCVPVLSICTIDGYYELMARVLPEIKRSAPKCAEVEYAQ